MCAVKDLYEMTTKIFAKKSIGSYYTQYSWKLYGKI